MVQLSQRQESGNHPYAESDRSSELIVWRRTGGCSALSTCPIEPGGQRLLGQPKRRLCRPSQIPKPHSQKPISAYEKPEIGTHRGPPTVAIEIESTPTSAMPRLLSTLSLVRKASRGVSLSSPRLR